MQVTKQFSFEASHILPRHPGKCSRLHGHSYMVEVGLEGPILPQNQFVIDYADLTEIVEPIVDRFDHRHLNAFIRYPSAENIAAHIAHLIRPQLKGNSFNRLVVTVQETAKTTATWDSRNREDVFMLDKAEDDAEWRAPNAEIPLAPLNVVAGIVKDHDMSIKQLMGELNAAMIHREQLSLYIDSLTPADLSPIVGQRGVQ